MGSSSRIETTGDSCLVNAPLPPDSPSPGLSNITTIRLALDQVHFRNLAGHHLESWVFVGNPGVGKSTLLSCLAQRAVVRSGISYGGGLTMDVQTCVDYQRSTADTPGLANRTAERMDADAITRALSSSGPRPKLGFVVRLQYGRVVSQDLTTIERVLESIRLPNVTFGIIINCVGAAVCRKLATDRRAFRRLAALMNSGKYTTPHLLVIPEIEDLVDQDDCVVELRSGVRSALEQFPTISIPVSSVVSIDVDGFPASVDHLKRSVSPMEQDEQLSTRQHQLERTKPDFWKIAATALGVIGTVLELTLELLKDD